MTSLLYSYLINHYDSVGIPLSREEATRVMSKFSSNGRSIRYREFIKAFSFKEAKEGDQDIARMLSDGFRLNTETRSGSQNIVKALKDEFSRYNVKNNGQISISEFKRGLQSLQIDLTESELRKVIRRFDRDDSGFFNFKEIIDMIQYDSDGDSGRVRSRGTSREGSRGESREGSRGVSREGMREERRERDESRGGTDKEAYGRDERREGRRGDTEGMDRSRVEEGSKIEGNYRGKGKWYTGKVTRDRRDGTGTQGK
jgi:Ca2+-binding EF-hand superfamily protein